MRATAQVWFGRVELNEADKNLKLFSTFLMLMLQIVCAQFSNFKEALNLTDLT